MEENKILEVKKGAWTKEEDTLLRDCIHKFGEGKWHNVPQRAGLNRCRKSCRLRWLNYLRPNLKKGYFNKDEIDLVIRLHKLLGNRWSLIAGRIPGRTGNDVKNFWNTHILNKSKTSLAVETETIKTEKHIIFKPQPRSFKNGGNSNDKPSSSKISIPDDWKNTSVDDEFPLINNNAPFSLSEQEVDECIRWWLETEATPVSMDDEPVFSPTRINQKIAELTSLAEDAAAHGEPH